MSRDRRRYVRAVESDVDVETRAAHDSCVVWPPIGVNLRSAKVMILTVLTIVAAVGLLDLVVARGVVGWFD